jgi:hypothetical protein
VLGAQAVGWVLLPVLAYLAGRQIIGPYEGTRGFASFIGNIYGAAGSGDALALVLVFAPTLLLAIWMLQQRLSRWLRGRAASPRTAEPAQM